MHAHWSGDSGWPKDEWKSGPSFRLYPGPELDTCKEGFRVVPLGHAASPQTGVRGFLIRKILRSESVWLSSVDFMCRLCSVKPSSVESGTMTSYIRQVALLSEKDRATCLSVEILQLQNIAIVWHYLRDPTFSRFYTIPKCDRHTLTDGRTDTRLRHVLRLA